MNKDKIYVGNRPTAKTSLALHKATAEAIHSGKTTVYSTTDGSAVIMPLEKLQDLENKLKEYAKTI